MNGARAAALAVALFLSVARAWAGGDGDLHIYCINVGHHAGCGFIAQGDSTLIIGPTGKRMLIDGADGGACGADAIEATLDRVAPTPGMDYMLVTHWDEDHYYGIDDVATYKGGIYMPPVIYDIGDIGASDPTSAYKTMFAGKRQTPDPGLSIDLGGGATAFVVCVNGAIHDGPTITPGDMNDRSIGVLIRYGGFDYLTCGDLPTDVEEPLGAALVFDGITVDILHASHHGSKNSSSNKYISTILPNFGVISCGVGNGYPHPSQEAINHLNALTDSGSPYSPAYPPVETIYQTEDPHTEDPDAGHSANQKILQPDPEGGGSIHIAVLNGGCQYTFSNEGPGTNVFSDGPYPSDSGPPCPTPTPGGPTPIPKGDWPVKLNVNKTTFSRNDTIAVSANGKVCQTPFFPYVRLVDPFGRTIYLQKAPAATTRLSWTGPIRLVEDGPWVLDFELDDFHVAGLTFVHVSYGTWLLQAAFVDIYGNVIGGMNEKMLTVQ